MQVQSISYPEESIVVGTPTTSCVYVCLPCKHCSPNKCSNLNVYVFLCIAGYSEICLVLIQGFKTQLRTCSKYTIVHSASHELVILSSCGSPTPDYNTCIFTVPQPINSVKIVEIISQSQSSQGKRGGGGRRIV